MVKNLLLLEESQLPFGERVDCNRQYGAGFINGLWVGLNCLSANELIVTAYRDYELTHYFEKSQLPFGERVDCNLH